MPKAISIDLRIRIVNAIKEGNSCRFVAARFKVSPSSAIRYYALYSKTKSVAPLPHSGDKNRHKAAVYHQQILDLIANKCDLTLYEICDFIKKDYGFSISKSALARYFQRHRITLKKNRARQ